jgi:hypothetical protein
MRCRALISVAFVPCKRGHQSLSGAATDINGGCSSRAHFWEARWAFPSVKQREAHSYLREPKHHEEGTLVRMADGVSQGVCVSFGLKHRI